MTLLYGVVPPLMAWQLRCKSSSAPAGAPTPAPAPSSAAAGWLPAGRAGRQFVSPYVPGGTPVLAGMLAVAMTIGAGRIAADMGLDFTSVAGQLTEVVQVVGPAQRAALDATML